MKVVVAWSSIYLQFSSFNFLMSGLFGDILCLRFFLTWAYLWLFINALTGFPPLGELVRRPTETFLLHWDVLAWTTVTLYTHFSKFMGIVLNERSVTLPEESMPLWRMLYRNSGLSQLLFKQFVYPNKFQLIHIKAGTEIPIDNYLYLILDGVADTQITLQRGDGFSTISGVSKSPPRTTSNTSNSSAATPNKRSPKNNGKNSSGSPGSPFFRMKPHETPKYRKMSSTMSQRNLALTSGDLINVKILQLFRSGSESEAFANQEVRATALTDMTLYKISDRDLIAMARTPQTKQAYQGLLIFALTGICEREIMVRHFHDCGDYSEYNTHREAGPDGRDLAFQPLEEWEEPDPIYSGSGKALKTPLRHFAMALKSSFRPPWPIIRWIPGLRHAALPAPSFLPPPEKTASSSGPKDGTTTISSLTVEEYGYLQKGSDGGKSTSTLGDSENGIPNYGSTKASEAAPLIRPIIDTRGTELEEGGAGHGHHHDGASGLFSFFGFSK